MRGTIKRLKAHHRPDCTAEKCVCVYGKVKRRRILFRKFEIPKALPEQRRDTWLFKDQTPGGHKVVEDFDALLEGVGA